MCVYEKCFTLEEKKCKKTAKKKAALADSLFFNKCVD